MKPYYEQDGITIYHGDCREVLPRVKADVVVTDPPYGLSVPGAASVGPRGARNRDFFVEDTAAHGMAHVETLVGGLGDAHSIYAWLSHRQFALAVAMLEEIGWTTRFLVWSKPAPPPPGPGSGWPSGATLCVHGYRKGRVWNGTAKLFPPSNVLVADAYRHGVPGKVNHPTQLPLQLAAQPIRWSASSDCTILDPFMGSGTTLVAAKLEGRRAIGIEIEERYCEIAAKRLAQGVLPMFDSEPTRGRA